MARLKNTNVSEISNQLNMQSSKSFSTFSVIFWKFSYLEMPLSLIWECKIEVRKECISVRWKDFKDFLSYMNSKIYLKKYLHLRVSPTSFSSKQHDLGPYL